jgi:hypothetical protein
MFLEPVLSNLGKFKLLIVLLSLLLAFFGLGVSVYFAVLGYLDTVNPAYSEYFIGVAMGIFWAGGSGFVSLCFLYFLGRELSDKNHRILLVGSITSICPCVVYFISVIVSVVFT